MISLLISLLIFCVVIYILWMLLEFVGPKLGLPPEIIRIALAIIGLIVLVAIFRQLGYVTAF